MSGKERSSQHKPPMPPAPGRLRKTVVMVGMMGAGKTAVGRALAARLGVPFLDSDHEIETAANMTIPEIFARDGEAFFRDREAQVIARLLDEERGVLSTGGGAFLRAENRAMISQRGVSVWLANHLRLPAHTVVRNQPPLAMADLHELVALLPAAAPWYRRAAAGVWRFFFGHVR